MGAGLAVFVTAMLLAGCAPAAPPATQEPVPEAAAEPPFVRLPAQLQPPADRPLRAAFLIVDGVYNTELAAPYDILQHSVYHAKPGIETFTVSPDGATVTTAEGLLVEPHYSFATAPPADILIVPSAEHSRDSDLENREMIEWVRTRGGEASYVVSLCWGAFVLAEAGLLDGLTATTFPSDQERMAERYPGIDVRTGFSFVHHGRALTSEGGVRSYDVAMYLVDHLYGPETAQRIGGGLLISWPPAAGAWQAHVVAGD